MTAVIHQIHNYEHEAKVLAERRRRDHIDPLWRAGVLANAACGVTASSSFGSSQLRRLDAPRFDRLSRVSS